MDINQDSTKRTCQAQAILYGIYEPCSRRPSNILGMRLCSTHAAEVVTKWRESQPPVKVKTNARERHFSTENQRLHARVGELQAEIARLTALPPSERIAPPPKVARPVDGFIYFLRSSGHIKIGWTSDLEKRMKAYPPDTLLLAVKPGTRKDENALHRKFAHLLTHGREWFPLASQIIEEVDRVIAEHGTPPVVDFSARRAQRIVGPRLNKYVGGPNRGDLPRRTVAG